MGILRNQASVLAILSTGAAFRGVGTHGHPPASGQSCPTRTGILIFKYIILKIKYNVLHWILAFKYNKVACGEVFLVFKYCATTAADAGLPVVSASLRSDG